MFLVHRKYKKERTPRRRRRSKEKYITGRKKKTPMIEALKSNNPTSTIDAVSEF